MPSEMRSCCAWAEMEPPASLRGMIVGGENVAVTVTFVKILSTNLQQQKKLLFLTTTLPATSQPTQNHLHRTAIESISRDAVEVREFQGMCRSLLVSRNSKKTEYLAVYCHWSIYSQRKKTLQRLAIDPSLPLVLVGTLCDTLYLRARLLNECRRESGKHPVQKRVRPPRIHLLLGQFGPECIYYQLGEAQQLYFAPGRDRKSGVTGPTKKAGDQGLHAMW
ncbi:hypothetical protein MIND_00953500 [Mycena indigotica]|uniref:Uncharacterized protein n=1 Tax=Mycena indigotica TaxID=2126181 RepID=A0A8H6W2Q7_9AGAR|nr:uncharacterized protein MIND_00953500 [Mycena indigotica]KAF7297204.1 hypothetical protein MIND_00953500 [Mycena indigotica]